MTRVPASRAWPARALAPATVACLVMVAACHKNADFADPAPPVTRSVLELRAEAMRGDTARVDLTLGTGPTTSLGSLTAELLGATDWRLASCEPAQGAPLLACKQHGDGVKIAAAWVAGTNAGPLITLTLVRTAPTAPQSWQLAVKEAHAVSGRLLTDSLDIRREVTR
jgi:hypothetical protein